MDKGKNITLIGLGAVCLGAICLGAISVIVDMPMGIPPVVSSLNKSILTTSLTLKLYNQV